MTRYFPIFALTAVAASLSVFAPAVAQSGDDSEAALIVATQLRAQGYDCVDPHKAERDQSASTPGEEAWIVTCDNATYRVKLVPDQAAKVERID
ncbi:hypothetical protein [Microbaculum marinisediminis]|uniref:PepSY domain-containing protein n=1 Tax=Microbaculum marinisediminis TaxID=2931392 RepID=A0AAW5QSC6_9HYPH|nr:hypothetical protein [Microbaculum sp. A6E488]MCT8970946.1 hypothetical protein [Microbaculum sp. A6E488]